MQTNTPSTNVPTPDSTALPDTPMGPVVGGPGASMLQRVGLLFRSKLLLSSIVLGVVLLGGTSYIVLTKTSLIRHHGAVTATTPGVSGTSSSGNQTSSSKNASSSSTPASSTGSSTTSTSKGTASSSTGSTSTGATTPSSGTTTIPTTPPASGGGNLSNGNCFAVPSSCGYPDASNTGPIAGTTFIKVPEQATSGNGWTWDSRGWISVSGSNVTVNGIQTNADIDVTGSNVTIQNCIVSENNGDFGVSLRHTTNVTVKNCRISGTNASGGRLSVAIKSIYGDDVNPRSIANDVSLVSTGIQYCQGLIQDNYIHDLGFQNGDHLNGTTSNSGCDQLTIKHNTIFNSFDQTDAISLFQDFGREVNALITNNYLAGGGYSIYGGGGSYGTATNIQITNNRISDHYYANGGYWGWLAHYDNGGSGNVCSGNVLEHVATGKTVALGC